MLLYGIMLATCASFIAGVACWRYLSLTYRVLLVQVGGASIAEVGGYIIGAINGINNVPLFNIYNLFELWIITSVAMLLYKSRVARYLIIAGALFCSVIDSSLLWRDGIEKFIASGLLYHCLFYLTIFLTQLIRTFIIKDAAHALRDPDTWLCLGMIIYHGGDVPVLGFFNEMISHHPHIARSVYNINGVLCIVRYSLISIAFLIQKRNIVLKPSVA